VSEQRTAVYVLVAGAALVAALWFGAIAPKRGDRAAVTERVTAMEQRLAAANDQVARYRLARAGFPAQLAELRRLDVAVPGRGEIAGLLRELQRRARARGADLRVIALKEPDAASTGAGGTPGAVAGPSGLSALPFTLEFTGRYFDLLHLLSGVRRDVTDHGDRIGVGGRLLTIDGVSFHRPEHGSAITKASLKATAYVAPDGAATPQAPAGAASTPTPEAP
jgi:Tfp pilus assembly protein PilO